jgi:hypothetical protein
MTTEQLVATLSHNGLSAKVDLPAREDTGQGARGTREAWRHGRPFRIAGRSDRKALVSEKMKTRSTLDIAEISRERLYPEKGK